MRKNLQSVYAALLIALLLASSIPFHETALAQTDPVFVGAGDIANCGAKAKDAATAKVLDAIGGTVFTLGDNAYPDGKLTEFQQCYGPDWGRHKARTRPSPGNHDYHVSGAAGYYTYFGSAASPLDHNCTSNCKGYYSYNLGAWHIIALNSEVDHSVSSPQIKWLRTDLAAHRNRCTLAYWHRPLFSSGLHGNSSQIKEFWQVLYQYGADVVLNGHDHLYERFAPQSPSGAPDAAHGIREFVVGTGGANLYPFSSIKPNSAMRNNKTWGVLKLTLHATSYDWKFVPIAGQSFTDAGTANCIGATAPDLIFADSFESGGLSAWSSSVVDAGDLSVTPAAALVGTQGLQASIDDTHSLYVRDDRPKSEKRYRVRFYFDPNSIAMASGAAHPIFDGISGVSPSVLRVEFRQLSGNYQVRALMLGDAPAWRASPWFTIGNRKHFIELDWRAATVPGANNGGLTLWIDGAQMAGFSGVDNDTRRIDSVRLGAIFGIDPGTHGVYYLDAFVSHRRSYIGPAP
jgi:hypothetical protein